MNKSEQLIACLEGEIAKRDEELAACRVAVENCEVFRAELATIKEQEPTGWYTEDHLDDKSATTYSWAVAERWVEKGWPVSPLYAAPVSEAKARGVVMLSRDAIREVFMRNGFTVKEGQADLKPYVYAAAEELLRLSAPFQQVSVPVGWRELAKRADDFLYSLPETDGVLRLRADLCSMLAAPAAPAADAGIVDMYRHLQKVTPYRFKKIQDASITDGGDVMYFHKDRFDAALLADMAARCAAKGVE